MKRKSLFFSIFLLSLFPRIVFADTTYVTSDAKVIETTDDIVADDDSQKTTVKVSQCSTFKVSIPKTISLNGKVNETNSGEYTVSAEGNIASDEVIVVNPLAKSFYLIDKSGAKDNIVATIEQPIINFVGIENKNKNYPDNNTVIGMSGKSGAQKASTKGTITVDNLTAGDWEGNFNFHIQLGKSLDTESTVTVTPKPTQTPDDQQENN